MAKKNHYSFIPPSHHRRVVECIRSVPCPFISLLDFEVWETSATDFSSLTYRLRDVASPTQDFARAIIIELSECKPSNLIMLRAVVQKVLKALGGAQHIVDEDQWWFTAGVDADSSRWFVTVHANLYPASHSRHWPLKWPVISLTPEWIFKKVFANGPTIATRQYVRQAFAQNGLRYPANGGAITSIELQGKPHKPTRP